VAEDEFELDLGAFTIKPDTLEKPELIMLYGPYGQGKTFLAASASEVEDLYPILIIDTEGSTSGTLTSFDSERIDVIRPQKMWPDKEWLKTNTLLNQLLSKKHKYKTVIIDAFDVFFEWGLAHYAVTTKDGGGFAKWNEIHEALTSPKGMVYKLKNADFLVILVIHEKKEGGDDNSPMFSDFMWQGQGKAKLGQFPDVVGYVTRDTNSAGVSTTTLQTAPTKRNAAKSRFEGLPAKITDPSMQKLYDLINKKEAN